jgi:N-methylhydantoinase B/oxoprolinase/acetone carboxylase alpha subunit
MAALKTALATAMPTRVVTRDMKDFGDRAKADIAVGVFTLISAGEGGYRNYNGREAMDGKHRILLVGQIELAESALPSAVEDAEFAMIEEVKGFVRALPVGLCSLSMTGFRQSGQLDAPYGWVSIDMEIVE